MRLLDVSSFVRGSGPMMASTLSRWLPSIDAPRNVLRDAWDRLHGLPGGAALFSRMVGMMAPYTGTIGARVRELRADYARVEMPDRPSNRNHLRCVHAIALANLAELTGSLAVAYSLPDDARFIIAGLNIDYVKKARGPIEARCEATMPKTSTRQEYEVPVVLYDAQGEIVARVGLRTLVGPKRSP